MTPNPILDRLIAQESYTALLDELTPKQLSVTALRLDGIPLSLAAQLLGVSHQTLAERIRTARRHLLDCFPHIRSRVDDS